MAGPVMRGMAIIRSGWRSTACGCMTRRCAAGTTASAPQYRVLRDRDGDLTAFDGRTLVFARSRPLLSRALASARRTGA